MTETTGQAGEILDFLNVHRREMLEDLRSFVELETPSTEKPSLDGFADFLGRYAGDRAGGSAEILPAEGSGNHVRVSWKGRGDEPPIFLLGHYDTVWPVGTLETMPFRVEDGRARGPGVMDMKCGLVQGFWAVKALREAGRLHRPVVFLCNSDEEVGSPSSRALIESLAREAHAVLVLEPSADGALKTARKGAGRFTLRVKGKPSHAGADPGAGISAVEEMARLTLDLHRRSDPDGTGTTLNVGVVKGGTRHNVVAAEALAEVDVRASTAEEALRVSEMMASLEPHHPRTELEVEGGMMWPPLERTEAVAELFRHARRLADELGFRLEERATGGASDGCYCAAAGASVLDGLGAVGEGAHAVHEQVEVSSMPPRAALVARLMETL